MRNHSFRTKLFNSASSIILLGAGMTGTQALAQDQSADSASEVDQIVITGSRIARDGTTTPMPMNVVNSEQIELTFEQNINEVLLQQPQFSPGGSPNGNTGRNTTSNGAGLSTANLRSMGANRTLVLVNGKRRAGGQALTTAVDLNTIPSNLIERVDIVTGGASSVYGADAVSGAVNIILKDDFEGLRATAQGGITDNGDGESFNISLLGGTNFADGRGNVTTSFIYDKSTFVPATARDFGFDGRTTILNPLRNEPGQPRLIHADGVSFFFATKPGDFFIPGLFTDERGSINGIFTDDGRDARMFDFGEGDTGFNNGRIVNGDGQSFEFWENLRRPVERFVLSSNFHYDLNDNITFFFDGTYAKTKSQNFFQPNEDPLNFGAAPISIDNAFLPTRVRDAMVAADITSFGLNKIWTQIGNRDPKSERDYFQFTTGFNGELDDNWSYEVYFAYGSSNETTRQTNVRIQSKFLRALDSVLDPETGQAICRENLGLAPDAFSDCVALNPFGIDTADPEAVEFVRTNVVREDDLTQIVAGGHVTGELFDPWGAGPVSVAAGFEYRDEDSNAFPSGIQQEGLSLLPAQQITSGSYDVQELFGEVRMPLLSGVSFFQHLGVEGAFRIADYSGAGTNTSWHVASDWAPVDDIRFRAVYSQAVRAPNVGELFAPQFRAFQNFGDACDASNVESGSSTRIANCTAILGFDPLTFNAPTNGRSVMVTVGGNPDLEVEKAKTLTLGVVLTPSFVPGLSITVDYWDIDLDNTIGNLGAGTINQLCVDQVSLDNRFCDLVTRDSVTNGIIDVEDIQINAGALETSGYDFQLNYLFDLESIFSDTSGTLNFNFVGSYVQHRKLFTDPTDPEFFREGAGFLFSPGGLPQWRFVTRTSYRNGPLLVSWQMRFVGKVSTSDLDPPNTFDIQSTSIETFNDLSVVYDINEKVSISAAINNVFDNDPPNLYGSNVQNGSGGLYPNLGRTFFIGAAVDF